MTSVPGESQQSGNPEFEFRRVLSKKTDWAYLVGRVIVDVADTAHASLAKGKPALCGWRLEGVFWYD